MNVVIVEDEYTSQQYLKKILEDAFSQLQIVAIADNVPDAIAAIRLHKPKIVFLDVEIKQGTGFDVIEKISDRSFDIIFTTAFNTFAVEAFRYHAIDYLLKPLIEEQVIEATRRCLEKTDMQKHYEQIENLLHQVKHSKTRLTIHTLDGMEFIEVADIIYAEANRNYTELWLKSGQKITTSKKLGEIEQSLPSHSFLRVHHSYLVNFNYISKYHKGRGGYLVTHTGVSIPVSPSRKVLLLSWLG
jgi:two-component system LytT family response regulator